MVSKAAEYTTWRISKAAEYTTWRTKFNSPQWIDCRLHLLETLQRHQRNQTDGSLARQPLMTRWVEKTRWTPLAQETTTVVPSLQKQQKSKTLTRFFFQGQCKKTWGHLYKETVNRDVLKYRFGNRVADQWNNFEEVINASGINMFKNRSDKYLSNKLGE